MLNISSFPWSECSLTDARDIYIADSISKKRSKRSTGIQRYEMELVTQDMKMSIGRGVMAKLSKAANEILQYVHPRLSYSLGTTPVSGVAVNGSHLAGDQTISFVSVDVWQVKAGDYIQFSNDTKVYQSASDTLLQSGIQSIDLTFPLRSAISDTSVVTLNDITWHLSSDGVIEVDMVASDDQDMQLVLQAVEQL